MKLVPSKRSLWAIFIYLFIANIFAFYFIYTISSFDRAFSFPYEGNEIEYIKSWLIFTSILNVWILLPVVIYWVLFILINLKKNSR